MRWISRLFNRSVSSVHNGIRLQLISNENTERQNVDIIFVHGLGGDWQNSWMCSQNVESFWPKWLTIDLPRSCVWSLGYPAPKTKWTDKGSNVSMVDRSKMILDYLCNNEIGYRPIVFIAHSLGGLLVKKLLHISDTMKISKWEQLRDSVIGVVFIGTPHSGSNLSNLASALPLYRPSEVTKGLSAHCPHLEELGEWYRQNAINLNIKTCAYAESEKVEGQILVVDRTSANPGVIDCSLIMLDGNHFSISKPKTPYDPLYKGVVSFLNECIQEKVVASRTSNKTKSEITKRFLIEVLDSCFSLDWVAIELGVRERAEIELSAIYTDIDVIDMSFSDKNESFNAPIKVSEGRNSVLRIISTNKYLVLLGEPGSGKTTIINYLTICLSGKAIDSDRVNYSTFSEYWKLDNIIPIRIILREYVARGLLKEKRILDYLKDEILRIDTYQDASEVDFTNILEDLIETPDKLIFLLDGYDEVPEENRIRTNLRKEIENFKRDFPQCRILLTSRPYAYSEEYKLAGFEVRQVAHYTQEQIEFFVRNWYNHLSIKDPSFSKSNAQNFIHQLIYDIESNPRLLEISQRPLLLTLLTTLHRKHNGQAIPYDRQQLYEESVTLLLEVWQKPKLLFDNNGNIVDSEYDVWKELGISSDKLRKALNQIAYEVHCNNDVDISNYDIPARIIVGYLYEQADKNKLLSNKYKGERRILEYLANRTGILIERKQHEVYAFPHRAFQEYLAACHLADDDFPFVLEEKLRENTNHWKEVGLLTALKNKNGHNLWTLINFYCKHEWSTEIDVHPTDIQLVLFTGECLIETEKYYNVPERHRYLLERLKGWMKALMSLEILSPVDRATAARVLGFITDDRLGIPSKAPLFVSILSGNYNIGDDIESRVLRISEFLISKYLITNHHYSYFIKTNGYGNKNYWTTEGWAWLNGEYNSESSIVDDENVQKKISRMIGNRPTAKRQLPYYWGNLRWNISNHPVVGVTWFEAIAYCNWFQEIVNSEEYLYNSLKNVYNQNIAHDDAVIKVSLPTDDEWEIAARGPKKNERPYGNMFDQHCENTWECGIRRTCAVGLFERGQSWCGAHDLAGNVWEWCRSLESPKKYKTTFDSDNIYKSGWRIIRGGGWDNHKWASRSSNKDSVIPDCYTDDLGFRVTIKIE